MRPIDADELLKVPYVRKVTEFDETGCGISYLAVKIDDIYNFPPLDYTPLKHADWKLFSTTTKMVPVSEWVQCTSCYRMFDRTDGVWYKFCPMCGSKMDGGKEDG